MDGERDDGELVQSCDRLAHEMNINKNSEDFRRLKLAAEDNMTYLMKFGLHIYEQSWRSYAKEV